jgi:hypothetical protein
LQIDDSLKDENALAVARKIVERDGASALYQGWWSAVVSLGASNFVYFFTYNAFKSIYRNLIVKNPKAGYVGLFVCCSVPLLVVRVCLFVHLVHVDVEVVVVLFMYVGKESEFVMADSRSLLVG